MCYLLSLLSFTLPAGDMHGHTHRRQSRADQSLFAVLGGLAGGPQADVTELGISCLGACFAWRGGRLSAVPVRRQAGRRLRAAGARDAQRFDAVGCLW